MTRSRTILLAAIGAALINNYWVLEGVLAKRSDLSASWISDLAARSEAFGWRFELLEIASGLAVVAFAFMLLPRWGRLSPMIRYGLLALAAEGVLTVVGGAAPLSCAETLDHPCTLSYDVVDLIHATADIAATAAAILSFGLIGRGLARLAPPRGAGRETLTIGAIWLALTILTGVSFLSADVDSVKGLFQRAGQVAFGAWLILLGIWAQDDAA